jgi:branched-chain amino acid transport system ATP-binding protein
MGLLEMEGLTKRVSGLTAVDDVDLTVERGETKAIIGPNGAGKSTTINLITGLLEPTAGHVYYDPPDEAAADIHELRTIPDEERSADQQQRLDELRSEYGITGLEPHEVVQTGISKSFQTASIFPGMTARENVQMAALATEHGSFKLNFLRRQNSFDAVDEIATEMLEAVDLLRDAGEEAASLPYGDKRRLEIAIALASEPDLLFMDEPTAGMSPEETQATVDLVERLQQELGLTIVLVEHDMEIIFSIADSIAVLNRGAIIADGTPDEVEGDTDVQEAYLGGVEL